MRRLLIAAVLVVAALGAVIVVARWAAPLFGATGGPSWVTKTVYPLDHTGAIRDAARRYDLDPALVAGVIYAESRFDTHARSSQGAVGLMQILPQTAEQIARESGGVTFTAADLEDPRVNVRYGCYYPGTPSTPTTVTCARRSLRTTPVWASSRSGAPPRPPTGTRCASATSRTRRRAPT